MIAWITPEFFLDSDVFVIRHLAAYYKIMWYIICSDLKQIEFRSELTQLKEKGVHIEIVKICSKGMDPKNLCRFAVLAREIKDSGSKFVYMTLSYPFYFLPVMAHYIGTNNIVLGIHNVHVPKGGSFYFRNKLYNYYAIHRFNYFLVFSQSQLDSLRKRSREKEVRYIPFFLKDFGISSFKGKKSGCVTFLNFGCIRDYKRLDVLITAAQNTYKKTRIRFKVIIAGACENWEKYQNMIECKELFDLRLRHIHNEEIPDLFAEADYFVAPYQDIAQSGASIIALNYETPVIASRLPAFEEYIVDWKTGYLINPADPMDLQNKFEYILMNHERVYPQMLDNLRKNNEIKFNADRIENMYKELINDFIDR